MARALSATFHLSRRGLRANLQQGAVLILLAQAAVGSAFASGTITNCTEAALLTALRGGGSVVFGCDSMISLTSTILVSKSVVLDGTGHTTGISGGSTTNLGRLFSVQPGASLTLRNLTISGAVLTAANGTNGSNGDPAEGGAIYNDHGIVTLDGCILSDHSVSGGAGSTIVSTGDRGGSGGAATGAAIHNNGGQVIITNTAFSGNIATGGAGGAGLAGSLLGNGRQGGDGGNGGAGAGAAIYNTGAGSVVIMTSTFSSNRVVGRPGGAGGAGGGLLGRPGNSGDSGPGAGASLFNDSGSISIVNSTFDSNFATGSVGNAGAGSTGGSTAQNGTTGGPALGGGIYNRAGTVAVTNCTFVANSLTGGTGGVGGISSGVGFGSAGGDGGNGGEALGAGVYTTAPGVTIIVNCTFSDNRVIGGAGSVGGAGSGVGSSGDDGSMGPAAGAALYNGGGIVRMRNSILANGTAGGNAGGGTLDEGYNLSSDATAHLSAAGSRNSIDPLLDSYTTAGGLTATFTLSSNSPAINAITVPGGNGCPPFDQRNALRTEPCDIGAFEYNGTFGAPALQAVFQTNQVVVSWPAAADFLLQTATNLTASNIWTTTTAQSTVVGGLRSLAIAPTNQVQFFRLGRPGPTP